MPGPRPTMGTASGCGTTEGGGVGEPSPQPSPAGEGVTWRSPIGVGDDDYLPRLSGENRNPWWCDSGGNALTSSGSVAGGVPTPRPTMGTASGCGTTEGGGVGEPSPQPSPAGEGVTWRSPIGVGDDDYLPRLSGENRNPWWCDSGGNALTSSGSVAGGVPTPRPTMGTASGCGTTEGGGVGEG